jgi:N-acetylneuraminic acid mutarotase
MISPEKKGSFVYLHFALTFLITCLAFSPLTKASVWLSGSDRKNQRGAYGTKGTPHPGNSPGARMESAPWLDGDGNLWLFGGYGYDSMANYGYLNDLWKYDPAIEMWAWSSGSKTLNQVGTYGTKGVFSSTNVPGARRASVSWKDANNNLWLFGGYGYDDSAGSGGYLNDLWQYNITIGQWRWLSGSKTGNQVGSYGTRGVFSPSNVPGTRRASISWKDANGSRWLFGGYGYDSTANLGNMSDLWQYDIIIGQWRWVSGSSTRDQTGIYGTKAIPNPANVPGSRRESVSWTKDGTLWLFGGYGYDAHGSCAYLNDLWKYEISTGQWTWISGSDTINKPGTYGSKAIPHADNMPGARKAGIPWTDATGKLWLFGGNDNNGRLNDLWIFDGIYWTWVLGSNSVNQPGIYGIYGVPSPDNVPGARGVGVGWMDDTGSLWLFGGYGCDRTGSSGNLNDLWILQDFCEKWSPADLNRDCKIDFADLAIMADDWNGYFWR